MKALRQFGPFFLFAGLVGLPAKVSAQRNDAFLDQGARDLVAGARARRQTVDRSILDYRTVSTERMSVGYRIIGRDRLVFRRETAAKVHWQRTGPIEIQTLGAREVVPVATTKVQIPSDIKNFMPHIAFDPMDSEFLLRFDTTSVMHPLGSLAEDNYQFRSGDSTSIRLQDGRTVRLRELEFIPRRRDPELIAGAFWLDADNFAVVQAVFKLARPFDSSRDADKDGDKPPGWLPTMTADISYVAVDYGLYDLRWWLPRYVVAEGVVKFGSFGAMPMKYERTYSDYDVIGDTTMTRVAKDSTTLRSCRAPMQLTVHLGDSDADSAKIAARDARRQAVRDSLRAARAARRDTAAAPDSTKRNTRRCIPREYVITQAPDSVLLNSPDLPASIYAGESLLSQGELNEIGERLKDLPRAPWQLARPTFEFGLGGQGLVRYNRVEALSVGARGQLDLGRMSAFGELRFGTADLALSAELAVQRESGGRSYRLGGFRRLVPIDPNTRPFSMYASLGSLLLGNDEALFYRGTGAELLVSPATTRTQWYVLRMYGEHQADVDKNTDISARHLLDKDYVFESNIQADAANQYGSEITLRRDFCLNPGSLRAGIELSARGETGTFEFVRPALTVRAGLPLPFGLAVAAEGAAGTSTGIVPLQSLWYMGGTATLRGYSVGEISGESFWRGRGEIATKLPIARLALFSDVAWAGPRAEWKSGRPLMSAGVGVSLLDGIMRLDLARAVREPKGWRLHMYMGGVF
ncbi:MAG: BamA/TamA family outer membrane protein [Longimicrobiales bacterium]